jgi:predicted alpha-1,2-mannosidase
MRKNAFETPSTLQEYQDGKGRRALQSYLQYGYLPLEDSVKDAFHKNEQVSRTLEYAYDDYVLSRIAEKLGKTEDAELLKKRALNYRKVFDTDVGFVRGRYRNGDWAENFDPYQRQTYITEGTPYQYTFYVPQDVAGLIQLMGGKKQFIHKLDTLFINEEYWHGNEPSHHIAYLYPFAGAAWKTQEKIREIIYQEYANAPGGISGNDDAGQMSAWLVFSMMGFYPVTPGDGIYIIGSPVFDQVEIQLQNGKTFRIICHNNSKDNVYIQEAQLNGHTMDRAYFSHQELAAGATLEFIMGPEPNKKWATSDLPPSLSD